MAFDGIITKSVVSELNNILVGARVNKIFEPNKSEIMISLYNNGENYLLDLNIHAENYRICLSKYSKPNPINAMNYCMLLRKYLTGFKITSIKSYDLERIIKIQFEGNNEIRDKASYTLVIELMGRRSNIVLINSKGFIIDSLKHIITSTREILPARPYEYPTLFKTSFLDLNSFDEFYELISKQNSFDNISKVISDTFIGISNVFIDNILSLLDISSVSNDINDLKEVYDYLTNYFNFLGTKNITLKELSKKDFTTEFSEIESTETLNYLIDDFYHKKEISDNFNNQKNNLLKMILGSLKKCSKKLENINKKLSECDNMDKYRLYGELLTANLYKYTNLYETPEEVELQNYYDNNNLIKIKLDTTKTVNKNVERFFKKYNKLKNTLVVVTNQKKEAELELKYIESIIFSINLAESIEELNEIQNEFLENVDVKKVNYKNLNTNKQKKDDEKFNLNKYNINGYDVYVRKK